MSRPDAPDGGGFLSRWSRIKQEQKRGTHVEPAPELAGGNQLAAPTVAVPEETAEAPPLPSLDDITPGADVAAFFQKHVPEALRTAALRKLWVTDPEIKGFIEMADYQWDFNNPDSIPGWASKLDGVDVKAMVQRIFNVSPGGTLANDDDAVAEPLPEASPEHAPEALESSHEELRISTESSADSMSSGATGDSGGTSGHPDAAMRENTSDSRVYVTLKKRHGGALPT